MNVIRWILGHFTQLWLMVYNVGIFIFLVSSNGEVQPEYVLYAPGWYVLLFLFIWNAPMIFGGFYNGLFSKR